MAALDLDPVVFHRRARALVSVIKDSSTAESFENVDCLVFVTGRCPNDERPYQKSTTLQRWLLGSEFGETAALFTSEKMVFVTSQKKADILNSLKIEGEKGVPIETLVIQNRKSKEEAVSMFKKLFEEMKLSKEGKKIGVFPKDQFEGQFLVDWKETFAAATAEHGMSTVDLSAGIGTLLAVKDKDELKNAVKASTITSRFMKEFVNLIEPILDEGQKVRHEKLAETIEDFLTEDWMKKNRMEDVDLNTVEWAYAPIIQSGGKYRLKPSATSDESFLHPGTILCSLGVRYQSYCTNVTRTYMIDPEKSQERNYGILLELQDRMLSTIRNGVPASEVYTKAKQFLEHKDPVLANNFLKDCGFSIGIEFREPAYVLSATNNRPLKTGMILNLILGLENLECASKDPKKKSYALMISDTIQVREGDSILLTDVTKSKRDVCFILGDEAAAKKEEPLQSKSSNGTPKKAKPTTVLASKLRGDDKDELTPEQRRKAHQKELMGELQQRGLAKYTKGGQAKASKEVSYKKYESYRKETDLPEKVRDLKIYVDRRNESIILPIYGFAVPFHINSVKSIVKSVDTTFMDLRFNFVTPGTRKEAEGTFESPDSKFIRMLTFRSSDMPYYEAVYEEIRQMQTILRKRENERKQMEDIVEQPDIVEARRPIKLSYVFARPHDGRRGTGDLEIHQNGLRYTSTNRNKETRIDLLFSNIKHLVFQPCDHEMIVLLHIHLKNPIMIAKKKIKDVQFYRLVGEAGEETGNRKRKSNYGDEDELAEEEEERRRRQALNEEFRKFAEEIEKWGANNRNTIQIDEPFRELGFFGVPGKQQVFLQPTKNDCLVHLIEPPFTVVTMSEVEIVHLERVQFNLKNFDMVFIFKDYTRPTVHINMIPMDQLDAVEEWLDTIQVPFNEGRISLNWSEIMKTINKDPKYFFEEEGGWSFLQADSDGESGDDGSESASEFEMGSDEESEESESDYSESGSGSAASEDSEEEASEEEERKPTKKRSGGKAADERPAKKTKK
ncbi:FACT complex subunit SPT16 N-terminal lobe domain-containing protein [Cladochytrium replicatum]|nr:FACT complex subunit SPT16 N-terminal lobe domain-containing protein [Cladochytrium replicatum]